MNYCYRTGLFIGLGVLLLGCTSSATVSSAMESQPPQPTSTVTEIGQASASEAQSSEGQELPISAKATMAGQIIQLEVAQTPQQQAMGLMHRPPLPDDRGMLFPFDPPRPVLFWMKNTPAPLDMVFLLNGQVKAIAADVPPCNADPCPTYGPGTFVNQVIELRAGRAAELGLKTGDRVTVQFLQP